MSEFVPYKSKMPSPIKLIVALFLTITLTFASWIAFTELTCSYAVGVKIGNEKSYFCKSVDGPGKSFVKLSDIKTNNCIEVVEFNRDEKEKFVKMLGIFVKPMENLTSNGFEVIVSRYGEFTR